MFDSPFQQSIIKRACSDKEASIEIINIRDYASDKHSRVDDAPFGGDDGMVLKPEPLFKCIRDCFNKYGKGLVIYLTPAGKSLCHRKVIDIKSKNKTVYLLCGRYAGIDQRVIDHFVDEEISIGDYVISGGELAAMVLVDAVVRQIDGVLGNDTSKDNDTFVDGWLEHPLYTRPAVFEGIKVPDVLLSGDHGLIEKWQKQKSIAKTKEVRPDLCEKVAKSCKKTVKSQIRG